MQLGTVHLKQQIKPHQTSALCCAGVFGLPGGLAPLAASLPLTPTARFGAGLLAAAVVTTSVLALAARRLTAPARASSAVVKEELSEASQVERTPLTGTPPAALPDAQKLAALSTAADLFIGLLFALGLGVSGMLKPSKVAGERGCGRRLVWPCSCLPAVDGFALAPRQAVNPPIDCCTAPSAPTCQASCPSSPARLTPPSCASWAAPCC